MIDTQSSDKWYLNENLCNVSLMFKIIRRQQHKNLAIPQTKLVPKDLKMPFILKRHNFSIKLAFVMDINKTKCQTLLRFTSVGINFQP